MNEVKMVKPTGGCLGCAHCKMQRGNGWCNQFSKSGKYTKLSQKQLYNTKGYCSKFLDKKL